MDEWMNKQTNKHTRIIVPNGSLIAPLKLYPNIASTTKSYSGQGGKRIRRGRQMNRQIDQISLYRWKEIQVDYPSMASEGPWLV